MGNIALKKVLETLFSIQIPNGYDILKVCVSNSRKV